MGMFKEEIKEFEQLAALQTQLYPDACDIGFDLTDGQNERERVKVRNILKKWKTVFNVTEYKSTYGIISHSWKIFIPWEIVGTFMVGTEYMIWYEKNYRKEFLMLSARAASYPSTKKYLK